MSGVDISKLKKPYDVALLACGVLKRLGAGKLDTLKNRIETQKKQYFAQLFGVSPHYCYNLYWRGPYSPDLANDLFRVDEFNIEIKPDKFASQDKEEAFRSLQVFLGNKTFEDLELIATYHWLLTEARLSESAAKVRLCKLKDPTDDEVEMVLREEGVLQKCLPN
ncbi:hypothetical protein HQ545_02550 [Candidatus Woesearchaeota archaeon]|nr:hypothetical protein [Candidatus Woesearchaeota archaeon]